MRSACLVIVVATACTRPPATDPIAAPSHGSAPLVAGAPPDPAPKVERVPAGTGCLPPADPQIAQRQAEAVTLSRQAFDAELARLGLTPVHLPIHVDDERARTPTVHTRVDGISGEFVVGAYRLGCEAPKPWELARKASGEVVHVVRMPSAASMTTLVACGCQPVSHRCPPTCGMARSTQQLHGPLPPGTHFAGAVEIPHPVHAAVLTFVTGVCPATAPVPVCRHAP